MTSKKTENTTAPKRNELTNEKISNKKASPTKANVLKTKANAHKGNANNANLNKDNASKSSVSKGNSKVDVNKGKASDISLDKINNKPTKAETAAEMARTALTNPNGEKFFTIKTYGCQMNVYDSEQLQKIATSLGFKQIDDYDDAHLVIINTCHIREKATEKMYSEIGRIGRKKIAMAKKGERMIIVIVGCVAQAEGEVIFKRSPFVDIVLGAESYHELPDMITKLCNSGEPQINIDFNPSKKFDFLEGEEDATINKLNSELSLSGNDNGENGFADGAVGSGATPRHSKPSEFVTIQEGCDKFCTFCVVPYTRGAEFSRGVESIIKEITRLAQSGTKEVVLLGQNVNAFHGVDANGKSWSLAQLIAKVAEIDGIERIRYTTSHPNNVTNDLIAIHGAEPKLMPALNLPVQSGSNKVLKAMNRNHTYDEFVAIVKKLKMVRPELIMSSDFIVGFPTETDEDFEDTMKLVEEVGFCLQSFSFKYSPRAGTPAANKTQISSAVQSQRLAKLQALLDKQRLDFNKTFEGKEVSILFDNLNLRRKNEIGGRTEFMQIAIVETENEDEKASLYGSIRRAKVIKVNANSLHCKLV